MPKTKSFDGQVSSGSQRRFVFFTTAIVEIDNFLPFILPLRDAGNQVDVVALHYGSAYVDSPVYQEILGCNGILSVYQFVDVQPWRWLLASLSSLSSALYRRHGPGKGSPLTDKFSKLIRAVLRQLIRWTPKGSCNKKLLAYDFWIMSPGIIRKIVDKQRPEFAGLMDWRKEMYSKVVLFPETFDQFTTVREYQNLTILGNQPLVHALLSRGDPKARTELPDNCFIVDVGAPRYARYWCNFLGDFYQKNLPKNRDRNLTILYLPIKASPPVDWLVEEVKRQDRQLFTLLDRYDDIRIIVKPHPRTIGAYNDLSMYTKHVDRVEVYEAMVDTAELAEKSDICITGGTSFIPHLLWRNIPVVLTDYWAKKLGNEFLMKPCCFSWENIDELLTNIRQSTPIKQPCAEQVLVNMFQCGVSSDKYQEFLNSKLETL